MFQADAGRLRIRYITFDQSHSETERSVRVNTPDRAGKTLTSSPAVPAASGRFDDQTIAGARLAAVDGAELENRAVRPDDPLPSRPSRRAPREPVGLRRSMLAEDRERDRGEKRQLAQGTVAAAEIGRASG